MKLSINKFTGFVVCGVFLWACSSKEEPQIQPEPTQTTTLEEPVLPPSAQRLSPPPEEEIPAPVQTPAPVEASAPAPQAPAAKATQTLYPNEVLTNLKAWDKKLKFLTTHFDQTTQYDGVPVSKSQGTLSYDQAKHMLRLDTLNEDGKTEQSAITDKSKILILDGQGNQITTLSWQEWQQSQPNQALFDFGNYTALLARHNATLKEPYLLELTPKEGEKYTLYLTLSQDDYFPVNIKIVSDLLVTEAALSNTQKNSPLSFDIFRQGGLFK